MTVLTAIRQFLPLSDTLATAGQPTEAELAAVAQAGYGVIINLGLPTSDHALPDDQATVERLGRIDIAIPTLFHPKCPMPKFRFRQEQGLP
jgi:protein tyrosine phosphatase (PTP) superfamily phosphohydrolase (DUF442 family)